MRNFVRRVALRWFVAFVCMRERMNEYFVLVFCIFCVFILLLPSRATSNESHGRAAGHHQRGSFFSNATKNLKVAKSMLNKRQLIRSEQMRKVIRAVMPAEIVA